MNNAEKMAAPSAYAVFCSAGDIEATWASAWDDLAANAAEPNVFLERWFVEASLQHLELPDSLRIAFVWDEQEQLIGVTCFFIGRRYGRMVMPHVQSWSHYHSFLGGGLIRKGCTALFWATLLTELDHCDWVDGLIHLTGLVEGDTVHQGLVEATNNLGRPCDIVQRTERALLQSDLSSSAYYEQTVRKKKRKEIGRLVSRLSEVGEIACEMASDDAMVAAFAQDFLTLEAAGWKGKAGSALSCLPETEAFFLQLISASWKAGKLELLRLTVGDKPIAVLVNLIALPGSFSYKIAFDEDFARYSPGVLIQLENLKILGRDGFGWMDSCAVENHPMINSLWAERRSIIRVSIPLGGLKRGMVFRFCRTAEDGWAKIKKLKGGISAPRPTNDGQHND